VSDDPAPLPPTNSWSRFWQHSPRDPARIESWLPVLRHAQADERSPDLVERLLCHAWHKKPHGRQRRQNPKHCRVRARRGRSSLKLYQSAHQRVLRGVSDQSGVRCAGLPDPQLVPGDAEQINFVMRRMLPVSRTTVGSTVLSGLPISRMRRVRAGNDAALAWMHPVRCG